MGILNNVHPIYIIFPLILAILCLVRESKQKSAIIIVAYILIFVCAETGADYTGYKIIYENCFNSYMHGEFLYLLICKFFYLIGVSYEVFRIIFLSFFTILFAFSLERLSKKFSTSFLIAFLLFSIYLVSAYRQFATMAIFLFSLYLYLEKRTKILALLVNAIAIFIHTMAILQFLIMLVIIIYEYCVGGRRVIEKSKLKTSFLYIVLACFCVRAVIYLFLLKTGIGTVILQYLPYKDLTLIDFGLIARILELFVVANLYCYSNTTKNYGVVFYIYFLGTILYLILPLELIMERLISNFRLLLIVLVPQLTISEPNFCKKGEKTIYHVCQAVLVIIFVLVYAKQLMSQEGYQLIHMLKG